MDSALIVFTKAPYGHINAIEGARVGQGLLTLDIETAAVFIEDGVFILLKNQDPKGIRMHPVKYTLAGLSGLDVKFYAIKESMDERGITKDMFDDEFEIEVISIEDFAKLQENYDTTIFF